MDWSIVYLFIFLFSLILLVVGTKNPQIVFPGKNITRARYFLLNLFVSFLLLGLSAGSSPSYQDERDVKIATPTPYQTLTPDPESETLGQTAEVTLTAKGEKVKITNVVDGDTVKTETGKVVRLIGIDAPEKSGGRECFATESTAKLEELVLQKEVELEKDVSETDRYGRLLRYIWIGDTLINETMVKEGFAKSSSYPPDIEYQDKFTEAQREAEENNRGLWQSCFLSPSPTSKPVTQASIKIIAIPSNPPLPAVASYVAPTDTPSAGGFSCNCSKTCPQMSSCAEAQYQLNTCGCSARDGDHDGIACDSDCQ